jgi:hypothetical protein
MGKIAGDEQRVERHRAEEDKGNDHIRVGEVPVEPALGK